jgi:hypothetical protein
MCVDGGFGFVYANENGRGRKGGGTVKRMEKVRVQNDEE